MPAGEKELDFFLEPPHGNGARGLEWYEAHWSGTTPVRGEASPNYTAAPFHAGVPERAAALVPDARLVFVVRDPIDRIVSHYVHRRIHNAVRDDLEAMMTDLEDPLNGFVRRSLYMWQLDQWLEHYPAERVLVVCTERLAEDRGPTLDRIFSFLGVAEGFRHESMGARHNTAADRHEATAVGLALERLGVRGRLASRFTREVPRPTISPGLRARLDAVLRPDVERLRSFTGDGFPEWSL